MKFIEYNFQFRIWTENSKYPIFSSESELKSPKCSFQFRIWTEILKMQFSVQNLNWK